MPAYVHMNLRVIDQEKHSAFLPRFLQALADAGGRLLYFGAVAHALEGDVTPLPLAGVMQFDSVDSALAFYNSDAYAPLKAQRRISQEARMFIVEAGNRTGDAGASLAPPAGYGDVSG